MFKVQHFSKRKRKRVYIYIYTHIYIYMCKHRLRTLLRNLRSTFKNQWKKHHPTFLHIFLLYIWKETPWIWMTHMKSPLRFCCLWVCRPPWHFSHLGVVLFGMPRCSESTTVGCPTKNRWLVGCPEAGVSVAAVPPVRSLDWFSSRLLLVWRPKTFT